MFKLAILNLLLFSFAASIAQTITGEELNLMIEIESLQNENKHEEAIDRAVYHIENDVSQSDLYDYIYSSAKKMGQYETALEYLLLGVEKFPNVLSVRYNLANTYQNLEQYTQAVAEYNIAEKLSVEQDNDYFLQFINSNRGACRLKGNLELDKAILDFTAVILLNEENPVPYYNRAICQFKLKQYEFACSDWKRASDLNYAAAGNYVDKYCHEK